MPFASGIRSHLREVLAITEETEGQLFSGANGIGSNFGDYFFALFLNVVGERLDWKGGRRNGSIWGLRKGKNAQTKGTVKNQN